jgi:hypothetical protein
MAITVDTQREPFQMADIRRPAEGAAEAQYRLEVLQQKGPRSPVPRDRAV